MPPPTRFPGRWVLLALACTVFGVTACLVLWTRSTPLVPQARERMEGMALPEVNEAGRR